MSEPTKKMQISDASAPKELLPKEPAPTSTAKPKLIEMRTSSPLHLGTEVQSHWLLGKSKTGNSTVLSMEPMVYGITVRVQLRDGAKKALLVPWPNVVFAALEE